MEIKMGRKRKWGGIKEVYQEKFMVSDTYSLKDHNKDLNKLLELEKMQKQHAEECIKKQEQEEVKWR